LSCGEGRSRIVIALYFLHQGKTMYFQAVQKLDALLLASICAVSLAAQAFGAPPAAVAPKPDGHAEVGPHKGTLIELGEEEYHAELVNDEKTHTATIYLLDGEVKRECPDRSEGHHHHVEARWQA
jgi:hypothetical protein